jgi:hypothetical protein
MEVSGQLHAPAALLTGKELSRYSAKFVPTIIPLLLLSNALEQETIN